MLVGMELSADVDMLVEINALLDCSICVPSVVV